MILKKDNFNLDEMNIWVQIVHKVEYTQNKLPYIKRAKSETIPINFVVVQNRQKLIEMVAWSLRNLFVRFQNRPRNLIITNKHALSV